MANVNTKQHLFAVTMDKKGNLVHHEVKRRPEDYKLHDKMTKKYEEEVRRKNRV